MKIFWRGAAALAIAIASAGCVSPQYPIHEGEQARAPQSMRAPRYPVRESAETAPATGQPAPRAEAPPPQPAGVPAPKVESQPLPLLSPAPASPSAAADGATTPASAVTVSDPPDSGSAAPASAPASPAASSTPADAPLAPRVVDHDVAFAPPPPATPPPTPASSRHLSPAPEAVVAYASPRRTVERVTIGGDVVRAAGVFQNYEVQKGDHLDALARAFDTSRSVILDANDSLRSPYRLRPGQILKVPVAKAYVAERGDTLSGVARRFGVEADELAELNHISLRAPLRDGQKIGLPSSMHDHGPIRARVAETDYAAAAPASSGSYHVAAAAPYGAYQPAPTETRPSAYAPAPLPPSPAAASQPSTPPYSAAAAAPYRNSAPSAAPYHAPLPAHLTPQAAAPALTDSEISAATHGKFVWPVRGDVVARFGPGGVGQRNDGIDIKAAQGAPVLASAAGEVVYAGDQVKGGFGKLVLIQHADGWFTAYAHLDSISVHMKDQVTQGQVVGQVGMSGDATQPMLHFEIRYHAAPGAKTQPVDPTLALPGG